MSASSYSLQRTVVTSFQQSRDHRSLASGDLYDDGVYVLHLASPRLSTGMSKHISSALSDRSIVSFNRESMQKTSQITNAHTKQITNLNMVDDNVVVSSSEDGFVKFFDLREHSSSNGVSSVFCKLPKKEEALSISFGYQGILLAVGSSNGTIHFFDTRSLSNSNGQQQPLGQYVDSHTQEVTKVQFMRNNDMILASGSEDGLVSIYDTAQPNEESALKSVLNVEASIRNLDFFGPQNEQNVSPGIWCMTGNETMSVWHWDTAQRMCVYGDNDIRRRLTDVVQTDSSVGSQFGSIDYLIGAEWNDQQQHLALLAGTSSGNTAIFYVSNDESFQLHGDLHSGHKGCVRAYDWNPSYTTTIITGGEDARLCEWDKNARAQSSLPGNKLFRSSAPQKGGGVTRLKKHNTNKNTPY